TAEAERQLNKAAKVVAVQTSTKLLEDLQAPDARKRTTLSDSALSARRPCVCCGACKRRCRSKRTPKASTSDSARRPGPEIGTRLRVAAPAVCPNGIGVASLSPYPAPPRSQRREDDHREDRCLCRHLRVLGARQAKRRPENN